MLKIHCMKLSKNKLKHYVKSLASSFLTMQFNPIQRKAGAGSRGEPSGNSGICGFIHPGSFTFMFFRYKLSPAQRVVTGASCHSLPSDPA